jgi:hypothetical protein
MDSGNNYRREVLFIAQIGIIFIIVLACILNLSLFPHDDFSSVWIALLSSSLGYLLPNPNPESIKSRQQT